MKQGIDYIGVGCGAVIINQNDEILLQLRNKSPEKGYWSIPGGRVEMFETIEDAVKREVKEETDLDVEVIDELGICNHIIENEKSHWVSPSYLCKTINGQAKIMEPTKHIDMKWFNLNELPQNLTITTKDALNNYEKYKKNI